MTAQTIQQEQGQGKADPADRRAEPYMLGRAIAERRDLTPMAKLVAVVWADRFRRGEPTTLRELAPRLGTRPQTIMRALHELETKGLRAAETAALSKAERTLRAAETATGALRKPQPPHTPHKETTMRSCAAQPADPQTTLLPEDQPAKPKTRTPKAKPKDTDPRIRECLTYFAEKFQAVWKHKPRIIGGRDGKLLKDLLKDNPPELIRQCIDTMLAHPRHRLKASIRWLVTVWDELRAAGNGQASSADQRRQTKRDREFATMPKVKLL